MQKKLYHRCWNAGSRGVFENMEAEEAVRMRGLTNHCVNYSLESQGPRNENHRGCRGLRKEEELLVRCKDG